MCIDHGQRQFAARQNGKQGRGQYRRQYWEQGQQKGGGLRPGHCKRLFTCFIAAGLVNGFALSSAFAQAGGLALGEARDGVTDRAYVLAPPNYRYEVARTPGSFVDCGEGHEARRADSAGRDTTAFVCSVTLTETIVIPTAAQSARIVIHY